MTMTTMSPTLSRTSMPWRISRRRIQANWRSSTECLNPVEGRQEEGRQIGSNSSGVERAVHLVCCHIYFCCVFFLRRASRKQNHARLRTFSVAAVRPSLFGLVSTSPCVRFTVVHLPTSFSLVLLHTFFSVTALYQLHSCSSASQTSRTSL